MEREAAMLINSLVNLTSLTSNQLFSLILENILYAWVYIRELLCIRDEQKN